MHEDGCHSPRAGPAPDRLKIDRVAGHFALAICCLEGEIPVIICADGEDERIIAICESRRDGREYDHSSSWWYPGARNRLGRAGMHRRGHTDGMIWPYSPCDETGPYFTIFGIDSYASSNKSQYVSGVQKGCGAVPCGADVLVQAATEAQSRSAMRRRCSFSVRSVQLCRSAPRPASSAFLTRLATALQKGHRRYIHGARHRIHLRYCTSSKNQRTAK